MRSQTSMISAMLWSIRSTPAPWSSRTDRTTAANSGTSASGSPAAGSSISTKLGSVASARATPSRRSCPWASAAGGRLRVAARGRAAREARPPPPRLAGRGARPERGDLDVLAHRQRAERVAVLERPGETVAAAPAGAPRVTSCPSSSTVPAVGRSKPVRRLTSVDLPAPFGPISPTTSCRCSSSVTSRSAARPRTSARRAAARSVPPGRRFSCAVLLRADRRRPGQIFGTTFATTVPTTFALVVLDPDHAVLPAEHRVQLRREAHEARERRDLPELLQLAASRTPFVEPLRA